MVVLFIMESIMKMQKLFLGNIIWIQNIHIIGTSFSLVPLEKIIEYPLVISQESAI